MKGGGNKARWQGNKRECECVLEEATKSLKVVPGKKKITLSFSLSFIFSLSFSPLTEANEEESF